MHNIEEWYRCSGIATIADYSRTMLLRGREIAVIHLNTLYSVEKLLEENIHSFVLRTIDIYFTRGLYDILKFCIDQSLWFDKVLFFFSKQSSNISRVFSFEQAFQINVVYTRSKVTDFVNSTHSIITQKMRVHMREHLMKTLSILYLIKVWLDVDALLFIWYLQADWRHMDSGMRKRVRVNADSKDPIRQYMYFPLIE